MKYCLPYSILIFILITLASNAQEINYQEFDKKTKFGRIEKSEFELLPVGKDSSASALMIFDVGNVTFSISNSGRWNYTYQRHKRIKILTKDGYDYANIEIPIYKSANLREELSGVTLASYNLEGDKIVQNKSSKDEKFADKFNSNWTVNRYTVSNIREGSIVEIKYTIQSEDIYNLRQWYFQHDIPVLWSDFSLTIPEYFRYKINFQSITDVKLVSQKTIRQNFTGMVSANTSSADRYNFDCDSEEKRWIARNVFAFKNEPFITTSDDYITKVDFELSSTKFPNDIIRSYSSSWNKIVEDLGTAESFGSILKPNGYTKELIKGVISPQDSLNIKIEKIFSYVKNTLKWNERSSMFASNKSVKSIFESKSGNSADINLTLVNLLNTAGINAYPFLISTRSNGRHPGIPLITKFNYLIAAIQINDELYFYDATNPYHFVNCTATESLNHQGLIVDVEKKNGEWRFIEPKQISRRSINNIFTFNEELQLVGKIFNRYTYYSALGARKRYKSSTSETEYLKEFVQNKSGLKITDYQADKGEDYNSYGEVLDVTLSDYIEEAGNLLYFNPLLFERTKENPFKSDERLFPIDFATSNEENYRFVLNIPDGYTVDKLPSSILYKLEDQSAVFSYTVSHSDKQILVNSKIVIGKTYYDPGKYFELKSLFKEIVSKQAEPIVLKKI